VATLGDFLPLSFLAMGGIGSAVATTETDRAPNPVPALAQLSPLNFPGPDPAHQLTRSPPIAQEQGAGLALSLPFTSPPPGPTQTPSGRRRRFVNAVVPQHLLSPTPYCDVLMAGRGHLFHRQGQGGHGPQVGGSQRCLSHY
jgi:hypothetical protein